MFIYSIDEIDFILYNNAKFGNMIIFSSIQKLHIVSLSLSYIVCFDALHVVKHGTFLVYLLDKSTGKFPPLCV